MYKHSTYHEALAAERIKELEQEIVQQRLLVQLPRCQRSLWWRSASALGWMMVVVGTRLERAGREAKTPDYRYGA